MKRHIIKATMAALVLMGVQALALLSLATPAYAYKKDALNIRVQSEVEDQPHAADATSAASDQAGKVYFLAPPLEKSSHNWKLLKPVDPAAMAAEVNKVLQVKGYRPAMQGDTPDMTITVLYGRGWVHNPYPVPMTQPVGPEGHGRDWTVREVIKMQNSSAYLPFSGLLEAKRQDGDQEKLAIIVTAWAWDPPAMKKHKAKRLWRTTMYIDEPDNRDLNNLADKLLAVGADYFNRETKLPEVEFTKPLPEGRVEVGTPKEVEPSAPEGR